MDLTRFIGMPYESQGRGPAYDCWGFVMLVSGDLFKRPLPDYRAAYRDADDMSDAALAMWSQTRADRWVEKQAPDLGDIVQFRIGRFACHVGIFVGDDEFLHCLRGRGSTMESLRSIDWTQRLVKVWRYEG